MDAWCVGFAIKGGFWQIHWEKFLSGLFTAGQSVEWPNGRSFSRGVLWDKQEVRARLERVMTAVWKLRLGDFYRNWAPFLHWGNSKAQSALLYSWWCLVKTLQAFMQKYDVWMWKVEMFVFPSFKILKQSLLGVSSEPTNELQPINQLFLTSCICILIRIHSQFDFFFFVFMKLLLTLV